MDGNHGSSDIDNTTDYNPPTDWEALANDRHKLIMSLNERIVKLEASLRDIPVHKPVKISTDVRDKFPVGNYVLESDIKGILGEVEDE